MYPASSLEPLEHRIAPATLLPGNRSVTYFDGDGDRVTVTVSKGTLSLSMFTFAPASTGIPGREQLESINLANLAQFDGANLTITAVPVRTGSSQGGDGVVDVGYINATGIDLGAVVVRGDLGAIDAGDALLADGGLGSLHVISLGTEGLATGAPNLQSNIVGRVGFIRVVSDIAGAQVAITGTGASLGSLFIGGSLLGSGVADSGLIDVQGTLSAVNIGGDVVGGDGSGAGSIVAGAIGNLVIGGTLYGGAGANSGQIFTFGNIGRVTLVGDIVGGDGDGSGSISSENITAVSIDGSVLGGLGPNSGRVVTGTNLTSLRIAGSLVGASAAGVGTENTGSISVGGRLGTSVIGGNIRGGSAAAGLETNGTGYVEAGSIGTMVVGGSLIGGSDNGGTLLDSATIRATGAIGSLIIRGGIFGGDSSAAGETNGSGYVEASRILAMNVNGSIFSGSDAGLLSNSGAIRALADIGTLTVRGSLEGNAHPVIISAVGQPTPTPGVDLAIRSLTIFGRVSNTEILAGYNADTTNSIFGRGVNADAQIGTVTVGGDWVASDLIAGVSTGGDGFFGDAADTKINITGVTGGRDAAGTISRIASIVIGGRALGDSAGGAVRHGFGAQHIVSLKIGGVTAIPLFAGAGNDTFPGGSYPIGTRTGTFNASGFNLHAYEVPV